MKTSLVILAGSLLAISAPAVSQQIVVQADTAVSEVTRDLDRKLVSAEWPHRQSLGEGIAIVRFKRGADGLPADVEFYRTSGSSSVDRLAARAVSQLGRKAPLPGDADQVYQANIIVSNSAEMHSKLTQKLAMIERNRLADPRERTVLAFTSGTRKAG